MFDLDAAARALEVMAGFARRALAALDDRRVRRPARCCVGACGCGEPSSVWSRAWDRLTGQRVVTVDKCEYRANFANSHEPTAHKQVTS